MIVQKEPQEQYEPVHSETERDNSVEPQEVAEPLEPTNFADNLSAIRSQVSGGELSSLRGHKLNVMPPEEECY